MKSLSDLELGYAAGIFDGEGSVSIFRSNPTTSLAYALIISITNTDPRILEWLKERFGGAVYASKQRSRCKQAFMWQSHGTDAARFLAQLYRHLVSKRDRAALALKFQSLKLARNPRSQRGWSAHLTDAELLEEATIAAQLKQMNQKGVKLA